MEILQLSGIALAFLYFFYRVSYYVNIRFKLKEIFSYSIIKANVLDARSSVSGEDAILFKKNLDSVLHYQYVVGGKTFRSTSVSIMSLCVAKSNFLIEKIQNENINEINVYVNNNNHAESYVLPVSEYSFLFYNTKTALVFSLIFLFSYYYIKV